jgi:hypothetical protein
MSDSYGSGAEKELRRRRMLLLPGPERVLEIGTWSVILRRQAFRTMSDVCLAPFGTLVDAISKTVP